MNKSYKFIDLPAYATVTINNKININPDNVYQQAEAFRNVYEVSKLLSKKVTMPNGSPLPRDEWKLIYSIPQSLVVQLAFSNELLLKAVLLGGTGKLERGHSLKDLIGKLDKRYVAYIKQYLKDNGLKGICWEKVTKDSDKIFTTARYGYDSNGYKIDFITLQLINEALDYIYHNMLPEWGDIQKIIDREDRAKAKEINNLIDLVFDEKYQAKLKYELEMLQKKL